MAKISEREKVLLGYSPNKCSSSRRNSEVDFSDVFGGPPRCSAQDHYYDEPDCVDDDDDSCGFRSSLPKRPIFGDQGGARMRYPSHDFYGDIFGGDQPLLSCSLPVRKQFASAPGSRDISPSRKLPPAAPQISTSPSNFSQPGKTSNTDYTTSTSMNQISKSSGRSLSKLSQTLQRISVYRPSSLSRQISSDGKEPTTTITQYNTTSVGLEEVKLYATLPSKGSISNEKFNGAEYEAKLIMNSNDNIRFHFSIHRWANKGVPISISSRKKSQLRSNNDILVMKNATPILNCFSPFSLLCESFLQDNNAAVKDELPSTTQVSEQAWFDDLNVGIKNVTEPENNGGLRDQNIFKSMPNGSEIVGDVHGPSQKSLDATAVNVSPNVTKSTMRPLASLFADGNEEEKAIKESKRKEPKKQVFDDIFSSVLDDMDADTITLEAKNDSNDNMQASSFRLGRTLSGSIEMVDAEPYILEEQHIINDNGHVSEPNIESTKAPPPNPIANPVDDQVGDESFQNTSTQLATESEDETQSYERKVKQWSKGKEGNIRALLSTLQYVLWPNSGWKPIPLVDLIEAAAVKKSYQRALLCLHPDKLQQKGASSYEKFIAERVFDILQVAWDQFNSLGLL